MIAITPAATALAWRVTLWPSDTLKTPYSETNERIVVAASLADVAKAFPDARTICALGVGVSLVKP